MNLCTIDGCDKPARTSNATLCPMHYHRQYRHGDTSKTANQTSVTASLGRRYRLATAAGHPLDRGSGRVHEHRLALYAKIGPGPHTCHWCGNPITWEARKAEPHELQVDHLDNDGANNDPANIVPSCRRCNTTRGAQRRSDALRDAGWWTNHDTIATRHERVAP